MKCAWMPIAGFWGVVFWGAMILQAQEVQEVHLELRYGIPADLVEYPQGDPKETIRSVIKATRTGDIPYMLAQLISPAQVDQKFHGDPKALLRLATKTTPKTSEKMITALEDRLERGAWIIRRDLAWSDVENQPVLSLERIGRRWFMHNTPVQLPDTP